ncbi:MAG: aminotransferase class III-fold pyridoxal phosphate-dependent enzyme, partial [Clostridiales bacterium]|nr:aminotransferase class III-fold pyridoxal phosphate-dependent enzyme [Clostridiales bacterium]
VTAAVNKVLDLFEENHIIDNVNEVGAYLEMRLEEIKEKHSCIIERRGLGLMQGLEFNKPVKEIIEKTLSKGLVLINAGSHVIRFIPPLIVTKKDIDQMISILDECIE